MDAVPFLPAARAEFFSAIEQYADVSLELAEDFIAEVERALARVDARAHVVAVAHQLPITFAADPGILPLMNLVTLQPLSYLVSQHHA